MSRYLPSYVEGDDRVNLITARLVLTHRTGFPNWRPRGKPLQIHFTPGERFSYSGEGFVYLQQAVEKKQTVFDPLKMTDSSYLKLSRRQVTTERASPPSDSSRWKVRRRSTGAVDPRPRPRCSPLHGTTRTS